MGSTQKSAEALAMMMIMVLTTSLSPGGAYEVLPYRRFRVRISNALDGETIKVSCDRFLDGERTLATAGNVEFKFNLDLFLLTKVSCKVLRDSGWGSVDFVAFRARQGFVDDNCSGNWCSWIARSDGVAAGRGNAVFPWGPK